MTPVLPSHERDLFGRTPLHYTAKHGNALGASVLAKALPSLLRDDMKDEAGFTAVVRPPPPPLMLLL
jgi:hypothetical protein